MESELKLLTIARGSNRELGEDYKDYLRYCGLAQWNEGHPHFGPMLSFCRCHYLCEDYMKLFPKMNAEEMANMAMCLCHQVDKALESYIARKDREFTTEGGIRQRMTAARLDQRETQRQIINLSDRRSKPSSGKLHACSHSSIHAIDWTGWTGWTGGYPDRPGYAVRPGYRPGYGCRPVSRSIGGDCQKKAVSLSVKCTL